MAHPKIVEPNAAELSQANRRGKEAADGPHAIVAAEFQLDEDALRVQFRNGAAVTIPRRELGVAKIVRAKPEQLSEILIPPMRNFVWFPQLDEGFSVDAAIERLFGPILASSMGARGGKRTTVAKSRAAQANGAKGGRPRKKEQLTTR